jgi:hypothetical protein
MFSLMNSAAIKAVRIVHGVRTEYNALDCKILNKVAKLLIKFGAISTERLVKLTKLQTNSVLWALWHLEAVTCSLELWLLPE